LWGGGGEGGGRVAGCVSQGVSKITSILSHIV